MKWIIEDVIRLHWKGSQKNVVLPNCQSNHKVILETDFLLHTWSLQNNCWTPYPVIFSALYETNK